MMEWNSDVILFQQRQNVSGFRPVDPALPGLLVATKGHIDGNEIARRKSQLKKGIQMDFDCQK